MDVQAIAAQPAHGAPVQGGILVVPLQLPGEPEQPASVEACVSALCSAAALFPAATIGHAEDPVAAAALIALRERGALQAVVTTVHHIATHDRGAFEDLQRKAVQESDLTICASQWLASQLEAEYGVTARVVPHGVEQQRFARANDLTRRQAGTHFGWGMRTTVLGMGGVQPRKGSRELLEAFARARGRIGEGALLVVAGPADHADYRARWSEDAERLGLRVQRGGAPPADCDVLELGAVDSAQMPALLRAVDVMATPSTREGFGLASIEASAAGVPNIVSDLPVFREHFTHGEDCLMVPVGDTRELAQALVRAACDQELRTRLTHAGHALAARFDWHACAQSHHELYTGLVSVA